MLRRMIRQGWVAVVLAAAGCSQAPSPDGTAGPSAPQSATAAAPRVPRKVGSSRLPNAYQLTDKVISGGQPDGEAAFKELQELGVKTVISVDGARPQVALAKKYGLKYVHLPHGYDGIPEERARELAKAVRDLPGPIYLHCHHGKHRSPAAAAVACVSAGLLPESNALAVLQTAGTSENYRGLYQSAQAARRVDDALLDSLAADFPETAPLPPMAEAMIGIEHAHDHLKLIAQARWTTPSDHPALNPAHEALLLREHFTELLRAESVKQEPERFQQLVREGEAAALALEEGLKSGAMNDTLNAAFETVSHNCAACHREFRDVPLGEKKKR